MSVHTYPVNDLIDHQLEGTDCTCGPDVDFSGAVPHVIHHSLDGREHREPDHDQDSCRSCSS